MKCKHCYADSSPESDHGTMTADDWERVVDDAHALSVDTVQFIGGEPTLHPELPRLVRYALGKGLKVDGIPDISELCGRCGRGRAAISLHGDLSPCVIGRFLVAGNVKDEPLGDILGGARWREIVGSIPAQGICTPADSNDCDPSRKPGGLDVAR